MAAKKRTTVLFSKITAKRVEFELKLVLQQIRLLQVCEMLRQKLDSTSTFCSKICTRCAFYWPKANLFCRCDLTLVYGVISRNLIQSEVTIHATCNNQRSPKRGCFLPVNLSKLNPQACSILQVSLPKAPKGLGILPMFMWRRANSSPHHTKILASLWVRLLPLLWFWTYHLYIKLEKSANFKALFPAVPMDLCLLVVKQNSVKKKNFEGSNLKSILSKGLKDRPS